MQQAIAEPEAPAETSVKIERLCSLNAPRFEAFTYSSHQWRLAGLMPEDIAFGAWAEGKPAGLVLALALPDIGRVCVQSIVTSLEHRRKGIAKALLRAAEEEAAMLPGVHTMEAVFASDTQHIAAVRRLLASCGWNQPERKHWICTAGMRFRGAPWIDQYRLSAEFDVLPWVELSAGDRERLRLALTDWIPPSLNPFLFEANLDPVCSIALRYRGELAGWVIAQRRGDDTLVYPSSFVRPDIRGRGPLISAYAEACKRQTTQTNRHTGLWIVPMIYPAMAKFADRRMRPYLDSMTEFLETTKPLHRACGGSPPA